MQELVLYHVEVEDTSEEVEEREGEENEERDGPEEKESCGGESKERSVKGVRIWGGFAEVLPQQGLATQREAYAEVPCMESGQQRTFPIGLLIVNYNLSVGFW